MELGDIEYTLIQNKVGLYKKSNRTLHDYGSDSDSRSDLDLNPDFDYDDNMDINEDDNYDKLSTNSLDATNIVKTKQNYDGDQKNITIFFLDLLIILIGTKYPKWKNCITLIIIKRLWILISNFIALKNLIKMTLFI